MSVEAPEKNEYPKASRELNDFEINNMYNNLLLTFFKSTGNFEKKTLN